MSSGLYDPNTGERFHVARVMKGTNAPGVLVAVDAVPLSPNRARELADKITREADAIDELAGHPRAIRRSYIRDAKP